MSDYGFLNNLIVLIVEDDNETQRQMQIMLRKKTGRLYTANNGITGLNTYREVKPDIIVTDLKMPVMDGIEMSREIRRQDKDTPIIITTAYDEQKIILSAVDVGINKYILKPVDTRILLEALSEAAALVLKNREGLLTSEGLITDRDEKLQKENDLKQIFAVMLKNDTGKGPLSIKAFIKGVKIRIECVHVLTKMEKSLLVNDKNVRMINYAREIYYLDRRAQMEKAVAEVIGLECSLESVKADAREDKDQLVFELKLY